MQQTDFIISAYAKSLTEAQGQLYLMGGGAILKNTIVDIVKCQEFLSKG